jgi:hypothetical protein
MAVEGITMGAAIVAVAATVPCKNLRREKRPVVYMMLNALSAREMRNALLGLRYAIKNQKSEIRDKLS